MDAVESVVIIEPWIWKMYPMMILKTMRTCSKNPFDHKCVYVLFADYRGIFATSNMELFMIMDKGYILDMASFQDLSLYHVTMLFIGLVLCKKIFYITGSILVKYYNVKSFFNVFEMRMHKYKSF